MGNFLDRALAFIEKTLPPTLLWVICGTVSGGILFGPTNILKDLGLIDFLEKFKGFISIAFVVSLIVILFKIGAAVFHWIMQDGVDSSDLDDEEKAILILFIMTQYHSASLLDSHPVVLKLKRRNFIQRSKGPIFFIVAGDPYDYFSLTKPGKKLLGRNRFQRKITDGLDQVKVLAFINTISREQYSTREPTNLR